MTRNPLTSSILGSPARQGQVAGSDATTSETTSRVIPDGRLLLRVEEAAERLGIGRSLMYRLVLSGEVQSVPVGRLRRIPCEALTDYVDRLRQEASAATGHDYGIAQSQ